jgi:hypothetical protein
MSLWIWVELSLFPRESSHVSHACAKYFCDGRLLPPFLEKFLYAHQATDRFVQEKEEVQELHHLLWCSQQGRNCVVL